LIMARFIRSNLQIVQQARRQLDRTNWNQQAVPVFQWLDGSIDSESSSKIAQVTGGSWISNGRKLQLARLLVAHKLAEQLFLPTSESPLSHITARMVPTFSKEIATQIQKARLLEWDRKRLEESSIDLSDTDTADLALANETLLTRSSFEGSDFTTSHHVLGEAVLKGSTPLQGKHVSLPGWRDTQLHFIFTGPYSLPDPT
jgi:hypothetical protein